MTPDTITQRRWHAFRVKPQKELWVARMLRRSDYRCAVPVRRKFRKRAFKGAERVYRPVPLMPGYVWIGFEGRVPWHDLFSADRYYMLSVVGFNGRPAEMCPYQVERMLSNQRNGVYADDLLWRKMRTNTEYKPGDPVELDTPGFEGWKGKCIDITNEDKAIVELMIFGSVREIEVPVEAAVRAA